MQERLSRQNLPRNRPATGPGTLPPTRRGIQGSSFLQEAEAISKPERCHGGCLFLTRNRLCVSLFGVACRTIRKPGQKSHESSCITRVLPPAGVRVCMPRRYADSLCAALPNLSSRDPRRSRKRRILSRWSTRGKSTFPRRIHGAPESRSRMPCRCKSHPFSSYCNLPWIPPFLLKKPSSLLIHPGLFITIYHVRRQAVLEGAGDVPPYNARGADMPLTDSALSSGSLKNIRPVASLRTYQGSCPPAAAKTISKPPLMLKSLKGSKVSDPGNSSSIRIQVKSL